MGAVSSTKPVANVAIPPFRPLGGGYGGVGLLSKATVQANQKASLEPRNGHIDAKEKVAEAEKHAAPPFPLSIAGSWNNFIPIPMQWDGTSRCYQSTIRIGPDCCAFFQLLQSGSWEKTYYPDV